VSPWRVTKRPERELAPGVTVHVSSAEVSHPPRLKPEWCGDGEPPARPPDRIPLNLPVLGRRTTTH